MHAASASPGGWTLLATLPPLDGRTGQGVRVAVVDSGVNVPHPHLPGVSERMAFDLHGEAGGDAVDVMGHGTAVAAAIHEKAPGAELVAVKVFDRVLATSVPTLVRALDWASERGARLVNLSLGTPNPFRRDALAGAVERARARGSLIVTAVGHGDEAWYPGALPGVVAVEVAPDCPREGMRVTELGGETLVLGASPYPRPIPGVPLHRNLKGVSFAVANVTGLLALVLEAEPGISRVEELAATLDALGRRTGGGGATSPGPS